MAAIFGVLLLARWARRRRMVPELPPWPLFLVYNGTWALLLLLEQQGLFQMPPVLSPIGLVGGNGVLIMLFGLPELPDWLRRRSKDKTAPIDPDRVRIVPTRKKRRQKRRR